MIRLSELKLPLEALSIEERTAARRATDAPAETAADRAPPPHPIAALRGLVCQTLGLPDAALAELRVHKRSFDARGAALRAVYIVDVALTDPAQETAVLARHAANPHVQPTPDMVWRAPATAPLDWAPAEGDRPVVVGFGPCGIFAALTLAEMGLRPLVLERGRPVRERTQDTWGLWRRGVLKAESNVQFGEGGAGLFSDGKLYSQIKDPRHLGRRVMQAFVEAGAPPEILYEAHPHIGTFKLVKVVQALRARITALGGEVRFAQRVADVLIEPDAPAHGPRQLRGLQVHDLERGQDYVLHARRVVFALGHSARDTFAQLHQRGVFLEPKPFSIGVRIEHPQSLIDHARWGRHAGNPLLGAAAYKLVHHARNGRTVYSFCMCPGGTVVAATSEPERVVTNGMSQYSRAERNANAGLVVGIGPEDFPHADPAAWAAAFGAEAGVHYAREAAALAGQSAVHPLAGVVLQRQLESAAYRAGGGGYLAPAQLVGDFVAARPSTALGAVQPSYQPGVTLCDLSTVLPRYAVDALREALPALGQQIRGYDRSDALMTGVETRTSAPLRITRGADCQSLNVRGLYPAGEGAGYAGGILSAGVDGIRVAEALGCHLLGMPAPTPERAQRLDMAYG
ncbi:NAD(P)/FAD-dependent oxidoreductase [Extensimonas sp. H3M7-6]|uniref:NAD(P)/FAD-dependent oxidoreductase n=1 Tax=Extensimonas soli TaxID=3031322 RepID=UPI0023DCC2D9|nr:FAD-dependent oxidoreductase [Extensimonas sp. H3M7-6]MDF1480997.1 FAD-dependent oxidoreductase [Extensimonas sp. H3M7-6]